MNKILQIFFVYFLFCTSVFAYQNDTTAVHLINKNSQKPQQNLRYDYQSTVSVPIKLSVLNKIKSDKDLYEGQIVKFVVAENVTYKGQKLANKGDIATARVETIISNGMNGIPASVIFGNFKLNDIPQNKISKKYVHYGADLSLLVFPIKWALTPLPPTGSLTNFIKGGRVRISPKKVLTIYYYPEW